MRLRCGRYARTLALSFLVLSVVISTHDSKIPRAGVLSASGNSVFATFYSKGNNETHSLANLPTSTSASTTAPSAPRNLNATPGNGQVTLNWNPPASNGGAPIYYYLIQTYPKTYGNGSFNSVYGGITNYTDTTVINGQAYVFNVSATNTAYQTGPNATVYSTPSGVSTPPSAPQYPYAYASNAQVQLSWGTPTHWGGAPITNYTVYRGISAGGETPLITLNATTHNYRDVNITNGVTYYYEFAAVNKAGTGSHTPELSVTPGNPPAPPTTPRNLTATGGDSRVTLHWQAPASNGGAVVYVYYIYRSTVRGQETYFNGSYSYVTNFTDTSLTNGQTYYYQIEAANGYGYSPRTNEVRVTPVAPTVPISLPSKTPSGVTLMTNATISNFNYNQTARSFTFTVTGGAPGSIGVANITLPKSLVGSNTNITIYIDGKAITSGRLFFDANYYYVYFTFHFSTHTVYVTLGGIAASSAATTVTINLLLLGVLVVGVVIGATAATLISRKRQSVMKIPAPINS